MKWAIPAGFTRRPFADASFARASFGKSHFNRSAFSLLELVLALGLSVIIFLAIANAIYGYVATITRQQKEIEQHQIAHNVMAVIANDLRAALQYKPVDVTGLEDLAVSQLLVAGIMQGQDDEDIIAATAAEQPDGESAGTEEASTDPNADCATCRPTMLGIENMILLDISRLPRIDEYNPLVATDDVVQLPSDLKGVTYFVGKPDAASQQSGSVFTDKVAQLGGLYRRQIDRAVAAYAGEDDIVGTVDAYAELLAPEVVEIAFRYFDGSEWVTEWNNVESGSFPPAIEVTITLDPSKVDDLEQTYNYSGFDPDTMRRYRSVVHLPIAEIAQ